MVISIRQAKGRLRKSTLCDICQGTLVTSKSVHRQVGGRVRRRDTITKYTAGWLRQKGYRMEHEMLSPSGGTYCNQDIVATKDGTCHVVDIQVEADKFSLSLVHKTKHQSTSLS